jgi:hypothetical protein
MNITRFIPNNRVADDKPDTWEAATSDGSHTTARSVTGILSASALWIRNATVAPCLCSNRWLVYRRRKRFFSRSRENSEKTRCQPRRRVISLSAA